MTEHRIKIANQMGQSFRIYLWLRDDARLRPRGSWRTLDKGFIHYHDGDVVARKSEGTLTIYDAVLFSRKDTWGITFEKFEDFWGVNALGKGEVQQKFVLGFKPGPITWALLD